MSIAGKSDSVIQRELNTIAPGARDARLGDVIYALLNAHNDLAAKYAALLAHLDAGNVAGLGNTNVATYGPLATSLALALPASR